ncbi:DUF4416 family protein [Pirellulaceae bacterium SH467]
MGEIKSYPPCVQLIGAFSRYGDALDWVWERVRHVWGEIPLLSERFAFRESEYYHRTMGEGLWKQFALCKPFYDPGCLSADKRTTNEWEDEYASLARNSEARPLNIDPGYLALTKLVLASTKNREHRIYLQDGVYAEVTLAFRDQKWNAMPWTYPDYQRDDFQAFFTEARRYLLNCR